MLSSTELRKLRTELAKVGASISIVSQAYVDLSERIYDPYFNIKTSIRSDDFRRTVLQYYPTQLNKDGSVTCQLTQVTGNGDQIVAAHLVPSSGTDADFTEIGLLPSDRNKGINGLLLAHNIERAFDQKRCAFVPHILKKGVLVFKILDPSLREVKLFDSYQYKGHVQKAASRCIGEVEGQVLDVDLSKICFRLFSRHAFWAFRHANKNKWTINVCPDDFGTPQQRVTGWLQRRALYDSASPDDCRASVDKLFGVEGNHHSEASVDPELVNGIYATFV